MKNKLLIIALMVLTTLLAACGETEKEKQEREKVYQKNVEFEVKMAAEELHKIYFGDTFYFESVEKVKGTNHTYIVNSTTHEYIVWQKVNQTTKEKYWAVDSI